MTVQIPASLLPSDGRFGSGPTKIRSQALRALGQADDLMGTSHRQAPIKNLVAQVQNQLAELHQAPQDHQVVLGNGGATLFWDVAVSSLIRHRSTHGVYGEFSRKFAQAAERAPFLAAPSIIEAPAGSVVVPDLASLAEPVDLIGWAQNETSTGACAPVVRPADSQGVLVAVDATSASGGMAVDVSATDVLYFAPQKNYSSDGGLWFAFCSPAALDRAQELSADRWIPESLDLSVAATNSAQHQTLNTPAVATLILLAEQLTWMLDQGGMGFVTARTQDSSSRVYAWAQAHTLAQPFVANPADRSPVVATIDFDPQVDAAALAAALRANGIVDTEPYRKLGRNQLRIACYTSIEPDDLTALTGCIDWLIEAGVGQR